MNFKFLALIAFATAVIAAPASEDAQADLVHTQAETPSHDFEPYVDPHVNFEARGETENYEEPQRQPKSPGYRGQPKYPSGKCKTAQCCQSLNEVNQINNGVDINLGDILNVEQDPNTPRGFSGFVCHPFTGRIGSCPSQPVCCSEIRSGDSFTVTCVPVTVTVTVAAE